MLSVKVLVVTQLCDSAIPRIVAWQAPLSMGFSQQEYWSGLPFPSPGDLPNLEIKTLPPALAGRLVTPEPPGKPESRVQNLLYKTTW